MLEAIQAGFVTTIEVVPPAGPDPERILAALESLADLPVHGFSVATNPVAKPRMSALSVAACIQKRTNRPAAFHCTTRDHNRLSLQGELWGARALGIDTVLVASGDFVALKDRPTTTTVRDTDVFGLIEMAREAGLETGVVLDPDPDKGGLDVAVRRLAQKVEAGAQYAVTQPVYDQASVEILATAVAQAGIPVILGVLPLRTPRHADFLHDKVAGIEIAEEVRKRMHAAADPLAVGIEGARQVLDLARKHFAGACVMPPFDHFEDLKRILD